MDNKARLKDVITIRTDDPATIEFAPDGASNLGLHDSDIMQIIFLRQHLAVLQRLRRVGVLLLGNEARFLEHRQINVGFDIAGGTRVTIPVPGTAEATAFFDQREVINTRIFKPSRSEHTAKTAADYQHFHLLLNRLSIEAGCYVGIIDIAREISCDLDVLVVAVGSNPLVTLLTIFNPELIRIKGQVGFGCRHLNHPFCLSSHYGSEDSLKDQLNTIVGQTVSSRRK